MNVLLVPIRRSGLIFGSHRSRGMNAHAIMCDPLVPRQSSHIPKKATHLVLSIGDRNELMAGLARSSSFGRGMVNETPPQWHWARRRSSRPSAPPYSTCG